MSTTTTEPRIYVACLASYNAGTLHGKWIDATDDADAMYKEVQAMMAASKEDSAEEYSIHDHEGFPEGMVEEFTPLAEVAEIVEAIESVQDTGAFFALLEYENDLERAKMLMEEGYRGHWDNKGDYAADFTESNDGKIPEHLAQYIDYEAMERDWDMSGDINRLDAPDGGFYIFDGTL